MASADLYLYLPLFYWHFISHVGLSPRIRALVIVLNGHGKDRERDTEPLHLSFPSSYFPFPFWLLSLDFYIPGELRSAGSLPNTNRLSPLLQDATVNR